MTQKVKWRTTHIVATVIGAALLSLTVRHALAINSPDLRTGVLATASVAAIMVGLTLLARFLSSRQQPTLYLTLGFLGSGLLLGVHAMFSSALIRDTAQWTTMLVEASDIMSDGLLSLSFLAGWAAWRWQAMLEKRVPTLARLALVIAVVASLAFVALALAAHPAFSKTADLVWVAFFVAGLIGFGLKNSRRPDTLERWLILAGIFLIYGQVVAAILGDGAGVGQGGTGGGRGGVGYFLRLLCGAV